MGDKKIKDTIEAWHQGVQEFDNGEIEGSLRLLSQITGSSAKMLYNMGVIYFKKNKMTHAIKKFQESVERDPHMALSHFAIGLINFNRQEYNLSRQSYEKAKTCFRGNLKIDYRQLGLQVVLFESEVLHNLALTYAAMMHIYEWPLEMLQEALHNPLENKQKQQLEYAIHCLKNQQLYDPHPLPLNCLFKPPKDKVDNLKDVSYLGKSKVISELNVFADDNDKPVGLLNPTPVNGRPASPRGASPRPSKPPQSKLPLPPTKVPSASSNTFRPISSGSSDARSGGSSPVSDKISHKDSLTMWHEGVTLFDEGKKDRAVEEWEKIVEPSAKILFNIAHTLLQLRNPISAEQVCKKVTAKDPHLAIGHFLYGVSLAKLERYDEAWKAFDKARSVLRGHVSIDYIQLGMRYKLYKCEILLNQSFCYMHSPNMTEWALELLSDAERLKSEKRHDIFRDAYNMAKQGQKFPLYEIPEGAMFRPPKSKIDNLAKVDFLGKAKVVSELKTSNSKETLARSATPPRNSSGSTSSSSSGLRVPSPVLPQRMQSPASTGKSASPTRKRKDSIPFRDAPEPPNNGSSSGTASRTNSTFSPNQSLPPTPSESPMNSRPSSPPAIHAQPPSPSADRKKKGPPSRPIPPSPKVSPSNSPDSTSPRLMSPTSKSGPPRKSLPPSPRVSSTVSSGPDSPRSPSPQISNNRRSSNSNLMPLPPSPLSKSPRASPVPMRKTSQENKSRNSSGGSSPSNKRQSMFVVQSYTAKNDEELTIQEGDLVTVVRKDGDWAEGEFQGKRGRFPLICVKEFSRSSPFK